MYLNLKPIIMTDIKTKFKEAVEKLITFVKADDDFKKLNGDLNDFLDSMDYYDFKTYLLDKRYIDIAYFSSNNYVFDLDSLYLDYKSYSEE